MYCHNCGKEVENDAKFCPYCGTQLTAFENNEGYQPISSSSPSSEDEPSLGFAFLSGLIPIVGVILFIVWYKEFPQRAKSCLKGLVAGIVLEVVLVCCLMMTMFSAVEQSDPFNDIDFQFDGITHVVPYDQYID